AIEKGRVDLALALLERNLGFEAECLRARAELQHGDPTAAFASIERARTIDSTDSELFATEAELLATLDRIQAAADVLRAGFQRCGPAPALFRAQGVIELRNQGHGRQALEALERARRLDSELPFLRFPLAQAHLL